MKINKFRHGGTNVPIFPKNHLADPEIRFLRLRQTNSEREKRMSIVGIELATWHDSYYESVAF